MIFILLAFFAYLAGGAASLQARTYHSVAVHPSTTSIAENEFEELYVTR